MTREQKIHAGICGSFSAITFWLWLGSRAQHGHTLLVFSIVGALGALWAITSDG